MSTTDPDSAPTVAGRSRRPPALAVTAAGAYWLSADGEIERLSHSAAAARLALERPLVCHAPDTGARLALSEVDATDVLELFAFVRPARFCLPTIRGLAAELEARRAGIARGRGRRPAADRRGPARRAG